LRRVNLCLSIGGLFEKEGAVGTAEKYRGFKKLFNALNTEVKNEI
jgi:hypothetical protein